MGLVPIKTTPHEVQVVVPASSSQHAWVPAYWAWNGIHLSFVGE